MPPPFLVVYAADEFISDEFRRNCKSIGIELLEKATEAHWSFGVCERLNAVLRYTFNKCWANPYFANWGKTALLAIATHFVNATVNDTNTSAYLLVFEQQPTFLSPSTPYIDTLINGERVAVMNIARSAALAAHCRMRYLKFKERRRPTDVDSLQSGSLC